MQRISQSNAGFIVIGDRQLDEGNSTHAIAHGTGLAYSLRLSFIPCLLGKEASSRVTGTTSYLLVIVICEKFTDTR